MFMTLVFMGVVGISAKAQAAPEVGATAATVGDRVVLRDGRVLLGLVTSASAGPKVGFEMLVSRAWAEAQVPDLAEKWLRNARTMRKPAVEERRRRLQSWRDDRMRTAGREDRIAVWIDGELTRMEDPEALDSPLLSVRIGRDGCRSAERGADAGRRLLALAWRCGWKAPEDQTPADLEVALEARGFLVDGGEFPSLDRLTPIARENEAKWLARRAATELLVDSGRRFVRFGDLLLPDPGDASALTAGAGVAPAAVLGKLGDLLNLDGPKADPLEPELARIAAHGGTGAVVTRLDLPPDLSQATVDIALWTLGPRGWVEYGARSVAVRPEDVAPAAGAVLGQDPQVQSVFSLFESMGIGSISPEMKERSLRIGGAVQQALGQAREAFHQDLAGLAFPVLDAPANRP